MSTISPRATREIHARLADRGIVMLDAPISGGSWGAEQGTLSIMVGGDGDALDRVRPVLEAMGKSITHCGPTGSGQATKLCNQISCVLNLQAVCESLVLATRSGLDPAVMIEAIKDGAAGSWALSNLGPRMCSRDFAPGFMVDLQQKDLRLVMEAADELNIPLPGTAMVHQFLSALQRDGAGREGTQALIKVIERLAGCEVRGRQL
jgi:3-hydroxyisobutyrate dehydrogenase